MEDTRKTIEIFDNRSSDRTIAVLYNKKGEVVNINFMQGEHEDYTILASVKELSTNINIYLLEIFNRLAQHDSKYSFEEKLDRACWLYVSAFITQDED